MENFKTKKPVVYIVGPTASGKTGLSVLVAKHFKGEVISGDSMQIYKGMHIASAAPDNSETDGIPHHLFEFLDSDDSYSVQRYVFDAKSAIEGIHNKGALPIVVGGTGLYVTSLSQNIDFGSDDDGGELRAKLNKRADLEGLSVLYDELKAIDGEYAEKISENDRKRIIRAIEVFKSSGVTMSQRIKTSKSCPTPYNNIFIGVTYRDRELLYERINRRVDLMVEQGLLDEARKAFERGGKTSVQAIGHKELFGFFMGEEALEEALEKLKMQTRRYAKRQMTWFRKNENINWIYMDEEDSPELKAIEIIKSNL